MIYNKETIVALATPAAPGPIAIIRISGAEALNITSKIFYGKDLLEQQANTIHFGLIKTPEFEIVDEVLISLFRAPYSYTKEDVIEISCHGSLYIINKIIELLINNGARAALPGEFTKRAFLNGRFDLTQAEYVSELINSDSKAAHDIAIKNMRGGFSQQIKELRDKLLNCTSLLELELDFGEEDVEFIDRIELQNIIVEVITAVDILLNGIKFGNVFKSGVAVVIAGKPNAGKSTLLNTIVQEEKAIVSDIPGTTRDSIDECIIIDGIKIRFTDTAGIRKAQDSIEAAGIERSFKKMSEAFIVMYIIDLNVFIDSIKGGIDNILLNENKSVIRDKYIEFLNDEIMALEGGKNNSPEGQYVIKVGNKIDSIDERVLNLIKDIDKDIILISASKNINIDSLKKNILKLLNEKSYKDSSLSTNMRHYNALLHCKANLEKALEDLYIGASSELIAANIRNAIKDMGEITGEITTEDILDNIFSKFCIGK